jgi:hypothetical protein
MKIEDYSDLTGTSYEVKEQVAPEAEFWHSIYIAGQTRKNHIGVAEQAGKLQVRGVDYNLDEVYGIIIHIQNILVKSVQKQGRESTECFAWCSTDAPWKGTSGRPCGRKAVDRAATPFCSDCKSQILMGFIRCNPDGSVYTTPDKKPVYMFIRGKGVKYSNVSNYIGQLSQMNLDPVFEDRSQKTIDFEKAKVNHKRFVTKITIGSYKSKFGNKSVFEFAIAHDVPKESIVGLLKISKSTVPNFKEKFDWSLANTSQAAKSYSEATDNFGDIGNSAQKSTTQNETSNVQNESKDNGKQWNFDDVDF